jgi:D-sedoheptulose 7-phosphate isomerase
MIMARKSFTVTSVATELAHKVVECYKRGGIVYIFGNGGLAAESEHFAAELMGKFGRDVYIRCIALTTNSSLITAISNDWCFEDVFYHQISVLDSTMDLFIGMTTSKSENIIRALYAATHAYLLNRDNVAGNDVAEVQENILKLLHQVAREAKDLI